jgi:hypothetical protein
VHCKAGEELFHLRLSAVGTGWCGLLTIDDLLELRGAVGTAIFENGHALYYK